MYLIEKPKTERRHPKWRNKWWKAVTLYNNPSLTLELIRQEMRNEKNKQDGAVLKVSIAISYPNTSYLEQTNVSIIFMSLTLIT